MIIVNTDIDGDGFRLELTGHACHDKIGQDIVCSAATILVRALAKRVEDCGQYTVASLSPGKAVVMSSGDEAMAAFETVMVGYRMLEQNYPECVTVLG